MGLFSRRQKDEPAQPAPADLRALVVPMLSGQAWMDANAEIFARIPDFPPGQAPFARPLTTGVYVTYAVDPGPSWEVVNTDAVADHGGPDVLHARARQNLASRGDLELGGQGGRFSLSLPAEADLSASLLLTPERWRGHVPLAGDLAVAVPTRVTVLMCSVDDLESLAQLRAVAAEMFEQADGKPVLPGLLRLTENGALAPL